MIIKIGYGNFLLCYIFTSVITSVLNTGKNCFVEHKQDILMKVGVVEYFLNFQLLHTYSGIFCPIRRED
jgi:hypothetical protein